MAALETTYLTREYQSLVSRGNALLNTRECEWLPPAVHPSATHKCFLSTVPLTIISSHSPQGTGTGRTAGRSRSWRADSMGAICWGWPTRWAGSSSSTPVGAAAHDAMVRTGSFRATTVRSPFGDDHLHAPRCVSTGPLHKLPQAHKAAIFDLMWTHDSRKLMTAGGDQLTR